MQSYRGVRKSVDAVMLILVGFLSVGCAGTRPSSTVDSEETWINEEAAEVPADSAPATEQATEPVEIDSQQAASTEECKSTEFLAEQSESPDCVDKEAADQALLDRTQSSIYGVFDSTTRMFDGLFGEVPLD